MALKWIIGDFFTGNISESNLLPVVGASDSVDIDINGKDQASLSVSIADLGGDWKAQLKTGYKLVALVDDEIAWSSGVYWAGFINQVSAEVGGVCQIQVTNIREWLATRLTTRVFNSTETTPDFKRTFNSSNYRNVMSTIVRDAFSNSGIPTNGPRNPAVLGTSPSPSGSGTIYEVLDSDAVSYTEILEEIRDYISDGEEFVFRARWSSSSKTKIVWDLILGTSTQPHINENIISNIALADNSWKPTKFSQSMSSDNLVSRIVGQSKAGDKETPSDFTTKTTGGSGTILIDSFYNPGQELTQTKLNEQLTSRLNFSSKIDRGATFERVYTDSAELKTILNTLGNTAIFTGSGKSAYFGLETRIVGIKFNASSKLVEITVVQKAARYPVLPKELNRIKSKENSKNRNTGRSPKKNGLKDHDSRSPVKDKNVPNKPNPYPTDTSKPTRPPFTNPNDNFTEDPIVELVDIRNFSGPERLDPQSSLRGFSIPERIDTYHDYPNFSRCRFNYETEELVGLEVPHRNIWGNKGSASSINHRYISNTEPDSFGTYNTKRSVGVYSLDLKGMFEPTADSPYYQKFSGVNNYKPADNFKKKIGEIPEWQYADLFLNWSVFYNNLPFNNQDDQNVEYMSNAEFSMFSTQDLKTIYVQIMVITSRRQKLSTTDSTATSYFVANSKVLKGVRNEDGVILDWESLGKAFAINEGADHESFFFSNEIYEINGQFKAFGGFNIPIVEDGANAVKIKPAYELKFYNNSLVNVDINNFNYNPTEIILPGPLKTVNFTAPDYFESINIPLAVNVDYKEKKVVLGFSKMNSENNLSIYYSSDFTLDNFTRIMETSREVRFRQYTGTNSNNVPFAGTEERVQYTSKAPVIYKDNYILSNAAGETDLFASPVRYANKAINFMRSKKSYDDVVMSSFPMSYTLTNILNETVSNSNKLTSFEYYTYRDENVQIISNEKSISNRGISGYDYYVSGDYIYILVDSIFHDNLNNIGSEGSEGRISTFSRYFIAKFKFKI